MASRSVMPKKSESKTADVVEEGSPARDGPAGYTGFGVVVQVRVPPVGGNLADEVVTSQQRLPQTLRGIDSSGKSAGHAYDGHGRDGCLTHRHRWFPCFSPPDAGQADWLKDEG